MDLSTARHTYNASSFSRIVTLAEIMRCEVNFYTGAMVGGHFPYEVVYSDSGKTEHRPTEAPGWHIVILLTVPRRNGTLGVRMDYFLTNTLSRVEDSPMLREAWRGSDFSLQDLAVPLAFASTSPSVNSSAHPNLAAFERYLLGQTPARAVDPAGQDYMSEEFSFVSVHHHKHTFTDPSTIFQVFLPCGPPAPTSVLAFYPTLSVHRDSLDALLLRETELETSAFRAKMAGLGVLQSGGQVGSGCGDQTRSMGRKSLEEEQEGEKVEGKVKEIEEVKEGEDEAETEDTESIWGEEYWLGVAASYAGYDVPPPSKMDAVSTWRTTLPFDSAT